MDLSLPNETFFLNQYIKKIHVKDTEGKDILLDWQLAHSSYDVVYS